MACPPHDWYPPEEGATALECYACDRVLPFSDLTPNMIASIGQRWRRERPQDVEAFDCALAAWLASRRPSTPAAAERLPQRARRAPARRQPVDSPVQPAGLPKKQRRRKRD